MKLRYCRSRIMSAVAIGLILAGCATNSELAMVRDEAAAARRTADQALNTAIEARQIANESNTKSLRTEEMLNRSFKHAMRK
ncbi:MAG: hypothetical protein J5J00_02590 [Deltaproteobacteria bacterium]|nr:hypothetical protein [Deltaproteobacteria bacterium]